MACGPPGPDRFSFPFKAISPRIKPRRVEEDRAEPLAERFTLQQLEAIANDTRLPGEIAGAYGVTAAVILRIQLKARFSKAQREAAARR
jgi:hypothetical protein